MRGEEPQTKSWHRLLAQTVNRQPLTINRQLTMRDHLIAGRWVEGSGHTFYAANPTGDGPPPAFRIAGREEVLAACEAAYRAFPGWSQTPYQERARVADEFAAVVTRRKRELAEAISRDTGKPRWEAEQEVETVVRKVSLSQSAYQQRTGSSIQEAAPGTTARLTHFPHGVFVVLGPFNFPAHLPNGHIVPALLAGNTIVFKPSELTPTAGALLADCWLETNLPPGVLNLVQGDRTTAECLLDFPNLAGVLFTGSASTGRAIHGRFGGKPEVLLALEMGGNNALIVLPTSDAAATARTIAASAFLTAGQRCTCARRLILVDDEILPELVTSTRALRVGRWFDEPPPFCGPVISKKAADRVLLAQQQLVEAGATSLEPCQANQLGSPFLRPGILDVTTVTNLPDEEIFGPLLLVQRAADLDDALALANKTRYGLAAGLMGGDRAQYEYFRSRIRAGIVNWNRPTTGASSAAPFGGIGASGNHRPSAFYAADYSAYPVASLEGETIISANFPGMG